MGIAELELPPPSSMNAAPASGTRGARHARHRAKRAVQADLTKLLLAAGVPRPIPGGQVRATARLLFPSLRRRDEGNYRTALEKALGDALAPHDAAAPFRWLPDDTPAHFTFGAVTFGQTELAEWTGPSGRTTRRRRPAVAVIRLAWAEDLEADLEAELSTLRRTLNREGDLM